MKMWTAFERDNDMSLKQKEMAANNSVICIGCGGTFFHQIKASMRKNDHALVVGQDIPTNPTSAVPYVLLQCIRCGDYTEPNVDTSVSRDVATRQYDQFLDQLEGKGDLRESTESTLSSLQNRVLELEEQLKKLIKRNEAKGNK